MKASKTGKASERPLDALRPVLDDLRKLRTVGVAQLSEYVICNRHGGKYTVGGMNSLWQKAMKGFGARFSMKDLRAKYAADLEAAGIDATRNLQHSSRAVTERHYLGKPATVAVLDSVRRKVVDKC